MGIFLAAKAKTDLNICPDIAVEQNWALEYGGYAPAIFESHLLAGGSLDIAEINAPAGKGFKEIKQAQSSAFSSATWSHQGENLPLVYFQ